MTRTSTVGAGAGRLALAGSTVWINELVLRRTPGLVGELRYVAVVLSGGVVLGAASALAWRLMLKPGSRA